MPRTVSAAFDEFALRIEPTADQKEDAKTKHGGVRDCLDGSLWLDRTFLTGSYARSTMIRPPNDIDLFAVLDAAHHAEEFFRAPDGVEKALQRFHTVLKGCYPYTPVRKDHPAVNLDFSTFGFDVVPAFLRQSGGYLIPSRFGTGWIPTDPTKHAELTTAKNSATGGYFVPLVKMFKSWNRAHYDKLTGFHLEVAMSTAWPTSTTYPYGQRPATFTAFSRAAAAVLPALATQIGYRTQDPAGLSGTIDDYLSWDDRQRTRERLNGAASAAQIALRHEDRGDHYSAIAKWRDIFGDPFPAYS